MPAGRIEVDKRVEDEDVRTEGRFDDHPVEGGTLSQGGELCCSFDGERVGELVR